jgi:TetR/AcrR family transcriptional regulator, transcriptional repressor for nem operon
MATAQHPARTDRALRKPEAQVAPRQPGADVVGRQAGPDTATRILDIAEELVQRRGFNGFSYANIAAELKITTASLHYHFPGKAELGRALITRYAARFFEALAAIEAEHESGPARLRAYADLYAVVLGQWRLCLCGMLAAEYNTLPEPMRNAVVTFFDDNERWLARVLDEGRGNGSFRFAGSPNEEAQMLVAGLEGAMLVARPYGDITRFQSAADRLIASVG